MMKIALPETLGIFWGIFWMFLFGVFISTFALSWVGVARRRSETKAILTTTAIGEKGNRRPEADVNRTGTVSTAALTEKNSIRDFAAEKFCSYSASSAEQNCASTTGVVDVYAKGPGSGRGGARGGGGSSGSASSSATALLNPAECAVGVTVEKLFAKVEDLSVQLKQRSQEIQGRKSRSGASLGKKVATSRARPPWEGENSRRPAEVGGSLSVCEGGTTKKEFDDLCSEIEASRNEWNAQASNDVHNNARGKSGNSARHNVSKAKRHNNSNHNNSRRHAQGRGSGGANEHGGSGINANRERSVAGGDAGGRSSCSGSCGRRRRRGSEGKEQQGGTRKSGNNPRTSPRIASSLEEMLGSGSISPCRLISPSAEDYPFRSCPSNASLNGSTLPHYQPHSRCSQIARIGTSGRVSGDNIVGSAKCRPSVPGAAGPAIGGGRVSTEGVGSAATRTVSDGADFACGGGSGAAGAVGGSVCECTQAAWCSYGAFARGSGAVVGRCYGNGGGDADGGNAAGMGAMPGRAEHGSNRSYCTVASSGSVCTSAVGQTMAEVARGPWPPSAFQHGGFYLPSAAPYAPARQPASATPYFAAESPDSVGSPHHDVWAPRRFQPTGVCPSGGSDGWGGPSSCFPPPLPLPRPVEGSGNVLQQARAYAPAQHLAVLRALLAGGDGEEEDAQEAEDAIVMSDSDSEDGGNHCHDDGDDDDDVGVGVCADHGYSGWRRDGGGGGGGREAR